MSWLEAGHEPCFFMYFPEGMPTSTMTTSKVL